ncbi:hypothetical protein FVE85_5736 [Porphyridium purpureum]|uniref:Sulfotransferase domain-containing protein n=1 Tax=Porphyridium purpureum TaxID=35688 RepID=A0A5J4Z2S7_PORPP|nr:hypothetical protein FVE85_5736 [Porphyridium purpureum]|eukprot:POR6279..scf295_1
MKWRARSLAVFLVAVFSVVSEVARADVVTNLSVLQAVTRDPPEAGFVADASVKYPMIINLAFGKSGTTSLTETLKKMGFNPVHWYIGFELTDALTQFGRMDLLENPFPNGRNNSQGYAHGRIVDVVLNTIKNGESLEVLSALDSSTENKFRAFTEIPMWEWPECKYPQITHLDELVRLNPNAKYILTVREIHSHVHSMIEWRHKPRDMGGDMARCANLSLENDQIMQLELEKWVTDTNNQLKKRMSAFRPPVPLLELEVSEDPISKLMWHVFPDGRVPPQVEYEMKRRNDRFPRTNVNQKAHV